MSESATAGQGEFVTVANTNEIQEGSMVGITAGGNQILLSKIGGRIYAIDAICSHSYGYLPRGTLRGTTVICPVHKAEYDLATGKVVKNVPAIMKLAAHRGATDLRSYEVEIVGESVRIRV